MFIVFGCRIACWIVAYLFVVCFGLVVGDLGDVSVCFVCVFGLVW